MDHREQLLSKYREASGSHRGAYLPRDEFFRIAHVNTPDLLRAGFSNYSELIMAAGGVAPMNHPADPQALLRDWVRVAKELGRPPSRDQYKILGRFGANTLAKHLGGDKWSTIIAKAGALAELEDDGELLSIVSNGPTPLTKSSTTKNKRQVVPRQQTELEERKKADYTPLDTLLELGLLDPPSNTFRLPNLSQFSEDARQGASEMAQFYARLYSLERQMRAIIIETLSALCCKYSDV